MERERAYREEEDQEGEEEREKRTETMDPEPEPEPEPGLDGESELIIETARREVAAQRNKLLDDALEELPATT